MARGANLLSAICCYHRVTTSSRSRFVILNLTFEAEGRHTSLWPEATTLERSHRANFVAWVRHSSLWPKATTLEMSPSRDGLVTLCYDHGNFWNVIAFDHNELGQHLASNSHYVICQILWFLATPNCGVLRPQIFSVNYQMFCGLTLRDHFVPVCYPRSNLCDLDVITCSLFVVARDYNISEVPDSLFVPGVHHSLLWPKAPTFEKSQNREKIVTVPIRP